MQSVGSSSSPFSSSYYSRQWSLSEEHLQLATHTYCPPLVEELLSSRSIHFHSWLHLILHWPQNPTDKWVVTAPSLNLLPLLLQRKKLFQGHEFCHNKHWPEVVGIVKMWINCLLKHKQIYQKCVYVRTYHGTATLNVFHVVVYTVQVKLLSRTVIQLYSFLLWHS